MHKVTLILLLFLLPAGKCVSQGYIKFTFETTLKDRIYPNYVILTNKKDYKETKQDFFTDFRVFKINKRKFKILELYTKELLAKIQLDSSYKKTLPYVGYEVEGVSKSFNIQDYLNSFVFPSFFLQFKEKLMSMNTDEGLILAMDTCQKQY